jgi:DNA repair protein SbcC/Rad50
VRPTHLSIEGLTAFRTLQNVDFSELDLFVITGPTGSGKTSILDAMTFALYGDICRVKSGELRDLISHGATHVKVALDFQVGGDSFRVARRMKKVGQGHDVHFVRVDGDEEIPACDGSGVTAVNRAIEATLGLDFSAFTKAVLLPQGAFHEFLKGDASARRKILIDLLDLNRYVSAGARARSQANLLSARLDERRQLIASEYGDATAAQLKAAKARTKEAKAAFADVQAIETEVKQHVRTAESGAATKAIGDRAGAALIQLKTDLGGYGRELTTVGEELNARREAAKAAEKTVKEAEKALVAAEARVTKVIADGDEAAIALLQAAVEARKAETATLAELNGALSRLAADLGAAEEAYAASVAAEKEAKLTLDRSTKETEAARADLQHTVLLLEYARAAADDESARTRLTTAIELRDAAIVAAEAAQTHVGHLQQADLAATLRAGLKSGDSCPVCEGTIAVVPKTERGFATALKTARAVAAAADGKRLAAERDYASTAGACTAAAERLTAAVAAMPKGRISISVDEADASKAAAETAAAEANKRLEQTQAAHTEATKAVADRDGALREARAKKAGCDKEINAANKRLAKADGDLHAAFPTKVPSDVDSVLEKRLGEVRDARKTAAQAAETVTQAQAARADALTAQHESENVLSSVATRFAETRTRAAASLEELERVNETGLPTLPSGREELGAQLEQMMKCCAVYIEAANEVEKRGSAARDEAVRALTKAIAPLELDLEGDADILESISERREELHGQLVQAEGHVARVKENIAKRAELEAAIRDDQVRLGRFKTLADELQVNHFMAYVLEESMMRLADLASVELLRISDGRYGLVPEKSGFDVIDHHNADERRSVATLSGGETFLASLALALALAGSVRDLAGASAAGRLDAIFIDEGFGALDPETLGVVLDALERLREGERMVGVISHVDELAQRIPQGLVVTKVGGSSTVSLR